MLASSFNSLARNATRTRLCRFASSDVRLPSSSKSPAIAEPSSELPRPEAHPSNLSLNVSLGSGSSQNSSPPPVPFPTLAGANTHPYASERQYNVSQEQATTQTPISNLPAPPQSTPAAASQPHAYSSPPFNTHHFFVELEKSFPTPTARSLMRATRALLVDRIGRVRREALGVKDLENQAYLFRAALSELRNEISQRQRNDSAVIRASLAALRREVDALDNKMKADIQNLKHEIQMDVDNRKTESKTDLKKQALTIEEVLGKAVVGLGDLRATTEEVKWTNMRKFVLTLGTFVGIIVIGAELVLVPPTPPPPKSHPTVDKKHPEVEGLEQMNWVT